MILVGDVGGTNARLALASESPERPALSRIERLPSRDFPSLEAALASYLATVDLRVERACFAIAGPVRAGRVRTPNLPWVIDAEAVARAIGAREVLLLNDLAAYAHGIATLDAGDLATLHAGSADPEGNQALIAAGTGLGQAGLHRIGTRYHPLASEGGHADFAPRNAVETALLDWLMRRHGRVSYERVLSGPGIVSLHEFLCDHERRPCPPWLAEAKAEGDAAAAIAAAGLSGSDETAVHALDLFAAILGAEAGNLALRMLATAGLFLGGGIAPRLQPLLSQGGFMATFLDKGRMRALLEAVPVSIVLDTDTGLRGAARAALLRA